MRFIRRLCSSVSAKKEFSSMRSSILQYIIPIPLFSSLLLILLSPLKRYCIRTTSEQPHHIILTEKWFVNCCHLSDVMYTLYNLYWILRQSDVNNIVWSAQRGADMQFAYNSNSIRWICLYLIFYLGVGELEKV